MMNPEPGNVGNAGNRPQQTATDEPWWLKHATRFVGTASSLAALVFGVLACITLTPSCLLAGILQMVCGVIVALIEAPCFCMFLDFAQVPSAFFEGKPFWYRAVLYIALSIMPISLCPVFSTFLGSGLIFVAGCMYAVMALGKKASFEEMRVKASSSYNLLSGPKQGGGGGGGDLETGHGGPPINSEPRKVGGAI